jgi:hypothetical protein
MFAAPPMTQAVRESRRAFSGRFASTAVEDVALSSEPTVALRASSAMPTRVEDANEPSLDGA